MGMHRVEDARRLWIAGRRQGAEEFGTGADLVFPGVHTTAGDFVGCPLRTGTIEYTIAEQLRCLSLYEELGQADKEGAWSGICDWLMEECLMREDADNKSESEGRER